MRDTLIWPSRDYSVPKTALMHILKCVILNKQSYLPWIKSEAISSEDRNESKRAKLEENWRRFWDMDAMSKMV